MDSDKLINECSALLDQESSSELIEKIFIDTLNNQPDTPMKVENVRGHRIIALEEWVKFFNENYPLEDIEIIRFKPELTWKYSVEMALRDTIELIKAEKRSKYQSFNVHADEYMGENFKDWSIYFQRVARFIHGVLMLEADSTINFIIEPGDFCKSCVESHPALGGKAPHCVGEFVEKDERIIDYLTNIKAHSEKILRIKTSFENIDLTNKYATSNLISEFIGEFLLTGNMFTNLPYLKKELLECLNKQSEQEYLENLTEIFKISKVMSRKRYLTHYQKDLERNPKLESFIDKELDSIFDLSEGLNPSGGYKYYDKLNKMFGKYLGDFKSWEQEYYQFVIKDNRDNERTVIIRKEDKNVLIPDNAILVKRQRKSIQVKAGLLRSLNHLQLLNQSTQLTQE